MEPWICTGAQEQNGCYSEQSMFQPGMCTKLWVCDECTYMLCKPCRNAYSNQQTAVKDMSNAADKRHYENEEQNFHLGEDDA